MTETTLFGTDDRGATVSPDGRYRYDLWRRWDDGPLLAWIMFNPSTADADVDDATITKITKFARRDGYAGLLVRNLYAYRTPKPSALAKAARAGLDVVGPENDEWLEWLAKDQSRISTVVAAWGAGGSKRLRTNERIAFVTGLFGSRLSRMDDPRDVMSTGPAAPHPLYLLDVTPIGPYPTGGSMSTNREGQRNETATD